MPSTCDLEASTSHLHPTHANKKELGRHLKDPGLLEALAVDSMATDSYHLTDLCMNAVPAGRMG